MCWRPVDAISKVVICIFTTYTTINSFPTIIPHHQIGFLPSAVHLPGPSWHQLDRLIPLSARRGAALRIKIENGFLVTDSLHTYQGVNALLRFPFKSC